MIDFKTKPLTLSQREHCSNKQLMENIYFTSTILWLRCGLDELKGEKITEKNFDEKVVLLSDEEIIEIAIKIREETQFPDKKKQP